MKPYPFSLDGLPPQTASLEQARASGARLLFQVTVCDRAREIATDGPCSGRHLRFRGRHLISLLFKCPARSSSTDEMGTSRWSPARFSRAREILDLIKWARFRFRCEYRGRIRATLPVAWIGGTG